MGWIRAIHFSLLMAPLAAAVEPIASLAQVRSLSAEQANGNLPVHITGTVLGLAPGLQPHFFLHDGTACCYVKANEKSFPDILLGDRVVVHAVTDPMGFYPSIQHADVRKIGHGKHPAPKKPDLSRIFEPDWDSAWVEVPAMLSGFDTGDDRLTLSAEVYGRPFKVELPRNAGSADQVADLMMRPVRLQGVLGTIFNHARQMTDRHFFVPSLDMIVPVADTEHSISARPQKIAQLLARDTGPKLRVRVRGVVTQRTYGGVYLRDHTGSTFVQAPTGSVEPGMEVQVDGYAAVSPYRPILRASSIQPTGRRFGIDPIAVDFSIDDISMLHAERVCLSAEFLGSRMGNPEVVLQMKSSGRFFEAHLPVDELSRFAPQPGDQLRLVGVCELTTTHELPRSGWVDGIRIHLPARGGIEVIRRAPWWNTRRLLAALGVTAGVGFIGFLTSWILRRKVKQQLSIIGGQLRAEAIGEERDRMARELHDTLEQQLSGVALQLDSLDHAVREDPAAAFERLTLARRMLRFTRTEARRSVWDLRSRLLDENGLAAALRGIAKNAESSNGPEVHVTISGSGGVLPPRVDFHFLRIAQEAVTNAIKHAEASRVEILLDHRPQYVSLSIRDNGCGFSQEAFPSSPDPHFGLLGMRERAARIGARLNVSSSPGQGCVIAIEMELDPHMT